MFDGCSAQISDHQLLIVGACYSRQQVVQKFGSPNNSPNHGSAVQLLWWYIYIVCLSQSRSIFILRLSWALLRYCWWWRDHSRSINNNILEWDDYDSLKIPPGRRDKEAAWEHEHIEQVAKDKQNVWFSGLDQRSKICISKGKKNLISV